MDLRFSIEETDEFFSNVMPVNLSKEEMESLKNRTEGWVAGLQLAALSLKESRDPTRFADAFLGTHGHVLDYLIEEVLDSQPEEMQEFLRRTSILDELSSSLRQAVTGQKASRKYLHYLETNNLFLVSLDEERTWYRYHALFGELLRNQLLQAEPERVDVLHERAADWYQNNGFIHQAVEQALQISSRGKVPKLIEQNAIPMLYKGEVSKVVGRFDRLPVQLIQAALMLCIGKAWSLALMQCQTRAQEVDLALQAAVSVPALPGCNTEGDTLEEAIANAKEAIELYLSVLKERGEPIPEEEEPAQVVRVKVAA